MQPKVSIDDLFLAANWLDVYEDAEDRAVCLRVSKWLRAEIEKREKEIAIREATKQTGQPRAKIVAKMREKGLL